VKRAYLVYGFFLLAALAAAVAMVRVLGRSEYDRALAKLGRSERLYSEARSELVMGTGDPLAQLTAYAVAPRRSERARIHALRILQELARMRPLPDQGAELAPLLNGASAALQLATLGALREMQSRQAAPAVAALFRSAQDSALRRESYAALRAAAAAVETRLDAAVRQADSAAIDSCVAICPDLVGGKVNLYRRLAGYYRGRGDSAQAAAYAARVGIVDTCWVVGPFDNTGVDLLERPLAPESRPFGERDTFIIDKETVGRWFRVSRLDEEGFVRFNNLFSKRCCSIAYLFTYLHVPSEREALLLLSYAEPTRVWLNDTLVHSQRVYRGWHGDDDAVRVHLKAGINRLLIKSVQDLNYWAVMCRVTDMYGERMQDVRVSWYAPQQQR
jgi:hypothetical protein